MTTRNDGPLVFVVQNQLKWDSSKNKLVPKYNLSCASEHGELTYLLSSSASPFNADSIIDELHQKLISYRDGDSILLVGNPCLIGWTVAIAALYNNGGVKLLQWSGREQKYITIKSVLFNPCVT